MNLIDMIFQVRCEDCGVSVPERESYTSLETWAGNLYRCSVCQVIKQMEASDERPHPDDSYYMGM